MEGNSALNRMREGVKGADERDKNQRTSPFPQTPSIDPSLGVAVCVCGIDPRYATVIGLRVASAQGTTGTDSRWHTHTQFTTQLISFPLFSQSCV